MINFSILIMQFRYVIGAPVQEITSIKYTWMILKKQSTSNYIEEGNQLQVYLKIHWSEAPIKV